MTMIYLISEQKYQTLIHNLIKINQLESLITTFTAESEKAVAAFEKDETSKLLHKCKTEKALLVTHLKCVFNINYNVDVHQKIAELKQCLFTLKMAKDPAWQSSMWLTDEETKSLVKEQHLLLEHLESNLFQLGVSVRILEKIKTESL